MYVLEVNLTKSRQKKFAKTIRIFITGNNKFVVCLKF